MLRPPGSRGEGAARSNGLAPGVAGRAGSTPPRLTFPPGVITKYYYFGLSPRAAAAGIHRTDPGVIFWSPGQNWGAVRSEPGQEGSPGQDSPLSSKIKKCPAHSSLDPDGCRSRRALATVSLGPRSPQVPPPQLRGRAPSSRLRAAARSAPSRPALKHSSCQGGSKTCRTPAKPQQPAGRVYAKQSLRRANGIGGC